MATRKETAQRKQALVESLREAGRRGDLRPGQAIPTVRELAAEFNLGIRTVAAELATLVDEGVLHTIPRVGTFYGQVQSDQNLTFLLIDRPADNSIGSVLHGDRIRLGFERRISQLGGATMSLPAHEAEALATSRALEQIAGVCDASSAHPARGWYDVQGLPHVVFGPPELAAASQQPGDTVYFDDELGGQQATQHLFQNGHTRIAFLGLHPASESSPMYAWSRLRAKGWLEATHRLGLQCDHLLGLPKAEPTTWDSEVGNAEATATELLDGGGFTAVVCASDHAALGLLAALRKARRPRRDWPSVVGFDDLPEARRSLLSSMQLPWEDVGSHAAQILWQRATGRSTGPAEHSLIPMYLVPRLSSRPEWSATNSSLLEPLIPAAT